MQPCKCNFTEDIWDRMFILHVGIQLRIWIYMISIWSYFRKYNWVMPLFWLWTWSAFWSYFRKYNKLYPFFTCIFQAFEQEEFELGKIFWLRWGYSGFINCNYRPSLPTISAGFLFYKFNRKISKPIFQVPFSSDSEICSLGDNASLFYKI